MKHIINEFKEFIMRGNVLDLAVGVIIGGAFQKIIASLVNDVIMYRWYRFYQLVYCTGRESL